MCGRFSLRRDRDDIQQDVAGVDEWIDEEQFIPRYNIAPRSQAPVIRRRDRDAGPSGSGSAPNRSNNSNEGLIMQTMKWGLVPHWSKFEDKSLNTTNARSENLIEGGGMWNSIKGKKRCAIPCQGYYEWLTKGKDKLPHFIKRKDNRLLLMAGLYDSVVLEGKTLWTFSIVTTEANEEFSWLHERQPVFLTSREALNRWLDTSSQTWTPELTKMVQPYNDTSTPLECYQVPKEVGKVGTESPSFIEPITNRKDGIEAMFSKQLQKTSPANPISQGSSNAKRMRETTPTPTPPNAKSKAKEEEIQVSEIALPSPSKRLKKEYGDDSNQPESAKAKINPRSGPSQEVNIPKSKASPKKRSPSKKDHSIGSRKIDSFFGKS